MKRTTPTAAPAVLYTVLVLGFALAYWSLFLLRDRLPFPPDSGLLGALRGYTPALAAVVTAVIFRGRTGWAAIWRRLARWRVGPQLWALAVLGPLAAGVLVVLLVQLLGHNVPFAPRAVPPVKLVLIFFLFALVDGPLGEEIGWRGFLLPTLLERRGPLTASLAVGVVWFFWHLPLYAATGRYEMTAAFFLGYLVNNVAFALVHTWFFLRSGGSALLAVAFHTAGNYAVYLSVTLWPGLEHTPARAVHLTLLVTAGLCAALALTRRGRSDARPSMSGPDGV